MFPIMSVVRSKYHKSCPFNNIAVAGYTGVQAPADSASVHNSRQAQTLKVPVYSGMKVLLASVWTSGRWTR